MPIIDSTGKKARFDALVRTNKDDALMSFIKASYNIRDEENRKEKVAEKLKITYELYKEKGAGTYGSGDRGILSQFESHYTMGYEMGIWKDSNFHLNELAIQVAEYRITIREYISTIFRNLFTFYEVDGIQKYHHFLYEVLLLVKNKKLVTGNISKDIIKESLPIEEKQKEQGNILFNYLVASDLFEKVGKSELRVSPKWQKNYDELIDSCNLEYRDKPIEEAYSMAKNKKEYAEYVTKNNLRELDDNIQNIKFENSVSYQTNLSSPFSRNRILFGAPGTGKSFTLKKEGKELLESGGYSERVTFHPDYSYANFVGTYKPVPGDKDNGEDAITYKYVPGPFMRSYVEALKTSDSDNPKPVLLIIEEINRANVAAVFGDIFQLLDRDENNVSEYSIQASEDMKKYLAEELGGDSENYSEIKLPDNFFIWATMNSADQGVFPMDTAFKRRWDFTYLGINDGEDGIKDWDVKVGSGEYERKVNWNTLRKAINNYLISDSIGVNEDKLMGPYFIAKSSFESDEKFNDVFKHKVLMYLFEDAAKHRRPSLFTGCENKNIYSEICREFDEKGILIFSDEIQENLKVIIEEADRVNYSEKENVSALKSVAENDYKDE